MLQKAFGSRIQVVDNISDWKNAIKVSVQPLIDDKLAEQRYLDGIYNNIAQNGDYIIIASGIAIPHTRSENGAIGNGFSMLKLNNSVKFSSGEDVWLIVAIVASGSDEHLDMLSQLTDIFMDDDIIDKLRRSTTENELKDILK